MSGQSAALFRCVSLTLVFFALACASVAIATAPYTLEVGPRTTLLEGPLLPNGHVDYVAALNQQIGEGVTPENNALVPLFQAIGPTAVNDDVRDEYFRLLGIPEPRSDGDYLIESSTWLFDRNHDWEVTFATREQFYAAQKGPWSREESPDVAAWYDAHEPLIPLIVEASERSQFYSPLVSTDGEPPLMDALFNALPSRTRQCGKLLLTRAMLRLHEGDLPGAWADLLACHRLVRLAANLGAASTIIGNLVFSTMSVAVCEASQRFAADERLSSEHAHECLAALDSLWPLPSMSAAIDVAERYQDLDVIQSLADGYVVDVSFLSDLREICERPLDWNIVMRATNEHYDQAVAAASLPTFRERTERIAEQARQLRTAIDAITARENPSGSRRQLSQQAADLLFGFKLGVMDLVIEREPGDSAFESWCIYESEAEAHMRLLRLAFMLNAYRSERGSYPDTLDALAPDYFSAIPLDPFSDEPFHYQRTDPGYRIYSVGGNLVDEEGRQIWSTPPGDDIVLEVPATEQVY